MHDSWVATWIVSMLCSTKHGSDSGAYDKQGRMVPQKLEEFFSKHDGDGDGKLTWRELWAGAQTNANPFDFFGQTAERLEWGVTWCAWRFSSCSSVAAESTALCMVEV